MHLGAPSAPGAAKEQMLPGSTLNHSEVALVILVSSVSGAKRQET